MEPDPIMQIIEAWHQSFKNKMLLVLIASAVIIYATRKLARALSTYTAKRRALYRNIAQRRLLHYAPGPFLPTYLALLLIGVAVAWVAYEAVTWLLTSSHPGQKLASSSQLEVIKTALTVTAGIGAGTGLYVAYRKQRVEEVNAVREQGKVYTERFQNAIKSLEDDSELVRSSALALLTGWQETGVRAVKPVLTPCVHI